MPTATARIGREKTLRTLAERLFVVDGPDKADRLRRAERALLRANPALAAEDAFHAGAVVVVPSDTGLATHPRVERAAGDPDGLLLETRARLRLAATTARGGFALAEKRAGAALAQLGDSAFVRKLREASREAAALAPQAAEAIKARTAASERHQRAVLAAIEEALAEVDRLEGRLKRRP